MLRAQSWKEGGSEWQPDPLKPALAIGWLSLGQIRLFGASVFLVCKRAAGTGSSRTLVQIIINGKITDL